jgi:hypothetical protein
MSFFAVVMKTFIKGENYDHSQNVNECGGIARE